MRAVALSDETVQRKVAASFVPLQIAIPIKTEAFPLDWPAMKGWSRAYRRMGGPECEGITGCAVVSPDLQVELGNTGSAFVWEMFESTAYDAEKFSAMLDRALARFEKRAAIRAGKSGEEQTNALATFDRGLKRAVTGEGRFRLPPRGFSVEGAKELFRLTGDLNDGQ